MQAQLQKSLWITKNKQNKIVLDLGDSKKRTNTLSPKRRRQSGAEQAFREITAESEQRPQTCNSEKLRERKRYNVTFN